MSLLTNALNQIRAWMQTNYPLGIQHLPPGLNRSQIEALVQSLPFLLPDEIFELYQWSAGNNEDSLTNHAFFFDPYEGMALCSLERAIALSSTFDDEFDEVAVKYLAQPLFPIFEFEGSFLCLVGNLDFPEISPVIYVSEIREITIRYESLTKMMLTLAECFTTAVISPGNQGFLVYDRDQFSSIYCKHNPDLLKLALVRLTQELALIKSKPDILKKILLNHFLAEVYWLTQHWKNLSLDHTHTELINSLIALIEKEDESVNRLFKQSLAELSYVWQS